MPATNSARWAVLGGGVALIALVLWSFFGEGERVCAAPTAGEFTQDHLSPRNER